MKCPYCGRKMQYEEKTVVDRYLKPLFCKGGFLRKHDVIIYYPHDDEFWTQNIEVAQGSLKNLGDRGYHLIRKGTSHILLKSESMNKIEG